MLGHSVFLLLAAHFEALKTKISWIHQRGWVFALVISDFGGKVIHGVSCYWGTLWQTFVDDNDKTIGKGFQTV